MFQKLSKKILTEWCGWKINITEPHPDKYIIALAPHTSNWDFIIGQLFSHALGIRINFLMKSEWFFWPLGILMRHLGGIPVRRSKHMNSTERIVREATEMKEFRLCITP
jgi:1-acyl-sn-glycerol-3-phosphate acyltransferase